uniref:Protein ZIP4 homolog n=1 Tax=Ciona savignyi TaxID=51511 RepID=H2ZE21_CIOSA
METLEGRLAAFRASIEYVTESLEVNRLSDEEILRSISSISDALKSEWISGVATSTSTTCSAMEHNFKLKMFAKQLEEVAISLWNATVGKKTSASIKETTAALLRQVCYDLIAYPLCTIGELKGPANIAYTQRRIMMASKVGKCWLELGEYDKAITAFEKATLDTQTLIESLSVPESEKTDAEVISLQKQLIELYCNTAIAASGAKDHARAFEVLTSAANFKIPASSPRLFDRQLDRVSATAYNLGLADTNARNLDSAIKWLNLSFEAGKRKHKTSHKHMALTLRLLAHVHSESGLEGNMQKALNAVELANTYHAHPA